MTDARRRFLRDIAQRIAADRVAELHLFAPLRHAAWETGVAVVAARADDVAEGPSPGGGPEPPVDSWLSTDAPLERDTQHATRLEAAQPPAAVAGDRARRLGDRLTIYRARYRLTLKGAERGLWEVDVTAEADAPLATVDDVVRGVARRAGEVTDATRMSGDAFRLALVEEPWTAPR